MYWITPPARLCFESSDSDEYVMLSVYHHLVLLVERRSTFSVYVGLSGFLYD